jgi:hypothetical protein
MAAGAGTCVLYVHGLGGSAGGPLERALVTEAQARGVALTVLRWDAGVLPTDATVAARWHGQRLLTAALECGSLREAAAWTAAGVLRDAVAYWGTAQATARDAARRLWALLVERAARGSTSVLAFSLGARVAIEALAALPAPALRAVHRVVLAGAAVPAPALAALPESLRGSGRVVNVHSPEDVVLGLAWPFVAFAATAAGRTLAGVPGVRNVRVSAGHGEYAALAGALLELATCPAGTRIPRRLDAPVNAPLPPGS